MPLGIDPKIDFAFKLVFGSPDHTRITVHFLNAVLNLPRPITQVEIRNPIQGKNFAEDKLVMLDVLAVDQDGRRYNVEMQTTLPTDLPKRLTYYNCINYVRQLAEGRPYRDLCPAISICVLDRVLLAEANQYHLSFRLRCDQRELVFSDDLVFHTLELPKYQPASDNIPGLPPLEKWLYFLKHAERLEANELAALLRDDQYREAIGVLEMISQTPEERQFYEARMKFLHDQAWRFTAAREEGHEEGLAKGMLIGEIQLLQRLLGEQQSNFDDLRQSGSEALAAMLSQLQHRLNTKSP